MSILDRVLGKASPKVDPLEGFRRQRFDDALSEDERRLAAYQKAAGDVGIEPEDAAIVALGEQSRRFCEGLASTPDVARIGKYLVSEMRDYIQITMPTLIVTKGVDSEETKRAITIATGLSQCLGWMNECIMKGDELAQEIQREENIDDD